MNEPIHKQMIYEQTNVLNYIQKIKIQKIKLNILFVIY